MEITLKAQRRARATLQAKAKAEAKEKNIPVAEALLGIIERGEDFENVVKAFSKIPEAPASEKEIISNYVQSAALTPDKEPAKDKGV